VTREACHLISRHRLLPHISVKLDFPSDKSKIRDHGAENTGDFSINAIASSMGSLGATWPGVYHINMTCVDVLSVANKAKA
jgi:hypothetical protein